MPKNNKYAVSLGGSVLAPDEINTKLLKEFCLLIKKQVKKGNKFIIIVGGGGVCRKYQLAAESAGKNVSNENKDWIGIYSTRLNAQLLRSCLSVESMPDILTDPLKVKNFGRYSIVIGGGWKPGWSTDFMAVKTAVNFGISQVINLGKPDYVYTADPSKNTLAKPIKQLTWEQYLNIIPSKWTPGLNTPFDPIASRLAQKNKIAVIVANGKNLKNFQNILQGKTYKGTTILT